MIGLGALEISEKYIEALRVELLLWFENKKKIINILFPVFLAILTYCNGFQNISLFSKFFGACFKTILDGALYIPISKQLDIKSFDS